MKSTHSSASRWLLLATSLLVALRPGELRAQAAAAAPSLPQIQFTRNLRNNELSASLGVQLSNVAAHYGKTESEFRQLISRDKCLCADKAAHLFYACEAPAASGTATPTVRNALTPTSGTKTTAAVTAAAPVAPVLHSCPASTKKVYLDFNGHTTTGTYWNSGFTAGAAITTPPFDLDGLPDSFSTAETDRIQAIWARVAEDFLPFDVDVTTEDPGVDALLRSSSTDTAFGVRVCIGGSSYDWYGAGAGGVAYVGSFIWNTDTPCFIFTAQLGAGAEKYTAEATSHEVGHTLGLNHDGQTTGVEYYGGHGDWAPIMGVGYYKNVTQWSKGEYASANNLQDDISVMASYGATPIADDHGNAQSTATALTGTSLTAKGIISTRAETDVFKFSTGAGTVNFNVQPAVLGPDLDIQLALYDSAGTLVSSINPTTGLAASLSATLNAGTYFLSVDGVGAGDPVTSYNDYASLGAYSLTGTVLPTTGQPPVASTANTTPKSGTAPLSVSFSSNGSYDPDGTIVSYSWDFGDGVKDMVPNPVHVYQKAGTYTATLVVTDNSGLTGTSSVVISVSADVLRMFVSSIAMVLNPTSRGTSVTAYVSVKDSRGLPVSGATLSGKWSGVISGNVSAKTNSQGLVSFTSQRTTAKGVVTFSVSNLIKTGVTYTPTLNVETSDSVTIP